MSSSQLFSGLDLKFPENFPSCKTTVVQLITIIACLYYYLLGFDYQDLSKSSITDFLLWLQLWWWLLENTGTGRKCWSSSTLRAHRFPFGTRFMRELQSYFWNNFLLFRLWNQNPASPCKSCLYLSELFYHTQHCGIATLLYAPHLLFDELIPQTHVMAELWMLPVNNASHEEDTKILSNILQLNN